MEGNDGWFEPPSRAPSPARCIAIASTASTSCPIPRRVSSRRTSDGPSEVIDPAAFR